MKNRPTVQYKPVNTFNMRPTLSQVVSYLVIALQAAVYLSCIHSDLSQQQEKIGWTMSYCFLLSLLCYSTYLTSSIDPSDPIVWTFRLNFSSLVNFGQGVYYYCTYCDSYCNAKSKHCRPCNRCVDDFDHHCIWINNCIGKRNYREFMVMIVAALLLMCHFEAAAIYYTINKVPVQLQSYSARLILVWILMGITLIFLCLLVYLVGLHFYLIATGQSTFQYMRASKKAQGGKKKIRPTQIQQNRVETRPDRGMGSPEPIQASNQHLQTGTGVMPRNVQQVVAVLPGNNQVHPVGGDSRIQNAQTIIQS